jgi:hypothetical protein
MPRAVSEINAAHLERIRAWYDKRPDVLNWASLGYRAILAHY